MLHDGYYFAKRNKRTQCITPASRLCSLFLMTTEIHIHKLNGNVIQIHRVVSVGRPDGFCTEHVESANAQIYHSAFCHPCIELQSNKRIECKYAKQRPTTSKLKLCWNLFSAWSALDALWHTQDGNLQFNCNASSACDLLTLKFQH